MLFGVSLAPFIRMNGVADVTGDMDQKFLIEMRADIGNAYHFFVLLANADKS